MSGKYNSNKANEKIDPKTLTPKKYANPKARIIKDGKCYTMEELYGKENETEKQKKKD